MVTLLFSQKSRNNQQEIIVNSQKQTIETLLKYAAQNQVKQHLLLLLNRCKERVI